MAQRRMFTQEITDSDAFLEMPVSTQNLYFHLGMKCDDDGFCNKIRNVMTTCKANDDDFKLLVAKRFVILFESGVMVVKHWKMHNYIQNDRYKETSFIEEKSRLYIKENRAYTLDSTQGVPCIQNVSKTDTQYRLGENSKDKNSIEKNSIEEVKHKYGEYKNVLLTDIEYKKLLELENGLQAIEHLSKYMVMKTYKVKSHYLAILKWVFDAIKEEKIKADKIAYYESKQNQFSQHKTKPDIKEAYLALKERYKDE